MSTNQERQPITPQMLGLIVQQFRIKELTQLELANLIGKSEGWVSKMLNGNQKTLDDTTFRKLEMALEIDFFGPSKNGNLSPLADRIASMVDSDPLFAALAVAASEAIVGARVAFTPRYVPTEEMAELGGKIAKIVTQNPDKPGKIAKLVLQLLAK